MKGRRRILYRDYLICWPYCPYQRFLHGIYVLLADVAQIMFIRAGSIQAYLKPLLPLNVPKSSRTQKIPFSSGPESLRFQTARALSWVQVLLDLDVPGHSGRHVGNSFPSSVGCLLTWSTEAEIWDTGLVPCLVS